MTRVRSVHQWIRVCLSLAIAAAAVAAITAAVPGPTRAESNADGGTGLRTYLLQDSVLVTAAKVPLRMDQLGTSVSVLSGQDLRLAPSSTLPALLGGVSGFHYYELGEGGGRAVLDSRGFTSFGRTSYLKVLLDGMPLEELETGRVDWTPVNLDQVEKIELVRGPVAYLYGNSSMAGLVNILTRRPADGWGIRGGGTGGSDKAFSSDLGLLMARRSTQFTAGLGQRSGDGHREHSRHESYSGWLGVKSRVSGKLWLRTRLDLQSSDEEGPGALPDSLWRVSPRRSWVPGGSQSADRIETSRFRGLAEALGEVGPGLEALFSVRTDWQSTDATETILPFAPLDRETRAGVIQAEGRIQHTGVHRLVRASVLGGELGLGDLESRYFESGAPAPSGPVGAGDVRTLEGGLYAFTVLKLSSDVSGSVGLRGDWYEAEMESPLDSSLGTRRASYNALSPALGLNFDLASALDLSRPAQFHLSFARSFKSPTLEQLFDQRPYPFDPDGPGPAPLMYLRLSNASLEPQTGTHLEAGLRGRPLPWLEGAATVYQIWSRNEIGFDLARFRYDNIEESTHLGCETTLSALPRTWLRLRLGYSFTQAEFVGGENDGNQINNVPLHQFSAGLAVTHPGKGSFSVDLRRADGQWLDEANRYSIPAYTVLDGEVLQAVGRVDLVLGASNLLDATYAPAAYLTSDVYGGDLPLYYPISGTKIRAGIRFDTD